MSKICLSTSPSLILTILREYKSFIRLQIIFVELSFSVVTLDDIFYFTNRILSFSVAFLISRSVIAVGTLLAVI